jgi:Virulence factor
LSRDGGGFRYNGAAMARYRIIQWRDLPAQVEATDDERTVQVPLSSRFQDLIDAVAMREGASESDAYLEGWAPGPETERPGDAETVARAVAAELEDGFPALVTRRLLGPPR